MNLSAACHTNRAVKRSEDFGVAAPRLVIPTWHQLACSALQLDDGGPEGQPEIIRGAHDGAQRAIPASEPRMSRNRDAEPGTGEGMPAPPPLVC